MCPNHRYFLNLKTELTREKENLRIEAPALDLLQWEDCQCSPLPKRLEAALRIFELQTQSDAQQQIEDSAKKLTVQRLPLRLARAIAFSRCESNTTRLGIPVNAS